MFRRKGGGLVRAALAVVALLGGCARHHATPDAAAPAVTLASSRSVYAVPARRISNLLNFETPLDMQFVVGDPASSIAIDAGASREGSHSLFISAATRSITIKLPTLIEGRPFPADWTLLGGYFYSDAPAYIAVSYDVAGRSVIARTVGIGAGAWTPVLLDLTAAGALPTEIGTLRFQFTPSPGHAICCDDVELIDNHDTIIDTANEGSGVPPWSVKRAGLSYMISRPGQFSCSLVTADAQQGGWSVSDTNPARAQFVSRGKPSLLTVYPDGRTYCDGTFRTISSSLADAAEQTAQNDSPAEISLPAEQGRVNRTTTGDADNDGYNESLGAYQLVAAGPRVEFTISPRTPVLSRPVVEIANLPLGEVRVTMEGRLIDGARRLGNGNLLIELPARIQRPTLVNVRVQ